MEAHDTTQNNFDMTIGEALDQMDRIEQMRQANANH